MSMKPIRLFVRVFVAATLLALAGAGPRVEAQSAAIGPANAPFWTGMSGAGAFERAMDARLAHAQQLLDALVAAKGPRTIANTLRPFDDLQLELDAVSSQAGLIQSVHPDAAVREAAERVFQRV